jgi:hypothetical protein
MWLRIWRSGGPFRTKYVTLELYKTRAISSLVEALSVASQDALTSMAFVIYNSVSFTASNDRVLNEIRVGRQQSSCNSKELLSRHMSGGSEENYKKTRLD